VNIHLTHRESMALDYAAARAETLPDGALVEIIAQDYLAKNKPRIEVVEPEPPPDVPSDPITKRGDIWQLGAHRVMCGDSADFSDVDRMMDGAKANMVFTDPPYNLGGPDRANVAADVRDSYKRLKESEWDQKFDFADVEGNILASLSEDATVYVTTSTQVAPAIWAWMDAWSSFNGYCVWRKSNPMPSMTKRHWTWCTELVCYGTRGKHTFNFPESGHALNVWDIAKNPSNDLHPTMKPIAIPSHAILHSSNPGNLIADFFGGAGSTLMACEQLGRRCNMMELSPAYVDVIVRRWESLTAKTALRIACG
jgi:DNA modification methylase